MPRRDFQQLGDVVVGLTFFAKDGGGRGLLGAVSSKFLVCAGFQLLDLLAVGLEVAVAFALALLDGNPGCDVSLHRCGDGPLTLPSASPTLFHPLAVSFHTVGHLGVAGWTW
ncbi:hypothetical protein [Nocardia brasiliensis]|uniref:hypothetical protein n=1 Tax=Nocardia brasiliensis TaxID=37326 RepID=UPI0004A6FF39|nr:hypothetical protein [Nocardia brasiliensis]